MNREGFTKYLSQRGKESHVILGLIHQVENFDEFLHSSTNKDLDDATVPEINKYSSQLESQKSGAARKAVRGLILYYRFMGKDTLAQAASDIREVGIARKRKAYPLREFLGVSRKFILILEKYGIKTAETMLIRGATHETRTELAQKTGIPEKVILELVKLSDLSRIEGVKAIRARLYHDAGVDTVEKMAKQEPDNLLYVTANFVRVSGFPGIAPLPREVKNTITTAKKLPKIVSYE